MGFLENLTKGFVRSAVNQVGRDGGKVISNKVYKDAHSTPVRVIGPTGNEAPTEGNFEEPSGRSRAEIIAAGYKPQLLESSVISYLFMVIGGGILPIVGPSFWLYLAARNLLKRNTPFYRIVQKPIYVSDKRHKEGQRISGYQNEREYSKASIGVESSERIVFVLKGLLALAIAIALGILQYKLYTLITSN